MGPLIPLFYGAFTLHGPGTGKGTGDGNRINGFIYIMFTVHTALRQGREPDPLSPIVLVPLISRDTNPLLNLSDLVDLTEMLVVKN